MDHLTSEQQLTALESLQGEPSTQLRKAADILGFHVAGDVDNAEIKTAPSSPEHDNAFREQWVLRWLIKRLQKALSPELSTKGSRSKKPQKSQAMINGVIEDLKDWLTSVETWQIFNHLFRVIPSSALRDILIDRNFFLLLAKSIRFVLQNLAKDHALRKQKDSTTESSDSESGRPLKRRRTGSSDDHQIRPFSQRLLKGVLDVAETSAGCLQSQHSSDNNPTELDKDWCDNIDGAASLFGAVLLLSVKCCRMLALENGRFGSTLSDTYRCINTWHSLWSSHCTATSKSESASIQEAFKKHVLEGAIELLSLVGPQGSSSIHSMLERQIALYVILPLRSVFVDDFKKKWEVAGTNFNTEQADHFCENEQAKILQGVIDSSSTSGHSSACDILRIACRLIPRSDIIRRRTEASWIEALLFCLSKYTTQGPRYVADVTERMKGSNGNRLARPGSSHANRMTVLSLLEIYSHTGYVPAIGFWRSYCRIFVLNPPHSSAKLLQTAVSLNIQIVSSPPGLDPTNAPQNMLALLCHAINGLTGSAFEKDADLVIVVDLLHRVFDELGRTRQLRLVLNQLTSLLTETFVWRHGSRDDNKRVLIWDQPDVFLAFRTTVSRYSNLEMLKEWLAEKQILTAISQLPDVNKKRQSGQIEQAEAYTTLACITMITEIAKATKQMPFELNFQTLFPAAIEAAQADGFWLKERWRFLALIEELIKIDVSDEGENVKPSHLEQFQNYNITSCTEPGNQAWMERFYLRSLRLATCNPRFPGAVMTTNEILIDLSNDLEKHSVQNESVGHQWNGTYEHMNSYISCLVAEMNRLAVDPVWTSICDNDDLADPDQLDGKVEGTLLRSLCKATLINTSIVGKSAAALLEIAIAGGKLPILQMYIGVIERLRDQGQSWRVSNQLLMLTATTTNKIQASILASFQEMQATAQSVRNFNSAQTDNLKQRIRTQRRSDHNTKSPIPGIPDTLRFVTSAAQIADHRQYLDSIIQALSTLQRDAKDFTRKLSAQCGDDKSQTIVHLGNLASSVPSRSSCSTTILCAELELSRYIFDHLPTVVNQHVIDASLSSLVTIASSTCSTTLTDDTDSPQPQHIFDRLCSIVQVILRRHRRRLVGRYHLLLELLQQLLKCFFYPSCREYLNQNPASYTTKYEFLESLPRWLNPKTYTSQLVLPPSSATHLSRLLTTLCDPSASAAASARRRRSQPDPAANLNLNDETRRARRMAGTYMQYLIHTYCASALAGQITLEVKENLMPGIYAVISAMDIEVMRGMNSAMGSAERSIWQDLYADWRRYGKWNYR